MIAAYIRRASTIKGATVAARDWDQGQERTQTRRLPEAARLRSDYQRVGQDTGSEGPDLTRIHFGI